MEFNGLFFPAPKCSYTKKSQNLIWIPSHPINTPAYHFHATQIQNTNDKDGNLEKLKNNMNSISKSPFLKCFCQEEQEEEAKGLESKQQQRNYQESQPLLHSNNSTPLPSVSLPPSRKIHKIQSQTICKCNRDKKCDLHTSNKKKPVLLINKSAKLNQDVSEEETKTNSVQQQHNNVSIDNNQFCKKSEEMKTKQIVSSSSSSQLHQNNIFKPQNPNFCPADSKNEDDINKQIYFQKRKRFSSYFEQPNNESEQNFPRFKSALQKGSLLSNFFIKQTEGQLKNQPPHMSHCHLHQNPQSTLNSRDQPSVFDKVNIQQNHIESTTSLRMAAQLGPNLKNICKSFIPCLYLPFKPGSDKILVYFHGNAEDLGYSYEFASSLRKFLALNVLVVEYPGYGLYRGRPNSDQILADADSIYEFIRKILNVPSKDIILFGRSIGSGPACYIAGTRSIGGLILMCPYTSIRNVVKNLTGSFISLLVAERFRNVDCIKGVKAPTLFIHGKKDQLIPYFNSLQLMESIQQNSFIHLPAEMTHNDFDFLKDMIEPTKDFFYRANIVINNDKKICVPDIYRNCQHTC